MGSNGQLFFGCMNGVVDMSCTCGDIFRPIFAPYSMKVAPYDTLAFQFGVNAISWYKFDNTGSPGTAQDYTTTAPANISGSQPNFPSYTLGQEENGLSFSATNRILLPTNMNYSAYPPAAMFAVETFTFWMNIPTQTSNPAIIFTRYDSTNSIKFRIALDTTNTVKVFIVGSSYFSSTLTIPASTWTLLIVSFKASQVSAFMSPSGYWQTTFPINQTILHMSNDTEYLGSTTSSFVGYLREFRVFSDSSLVNFVSTEFSTCLSGCTYGIGFETLMIHYVSPICLDPSTAPTCPSGQYLFSTNNNCYNCYYQCSACTGLSATDCNPCNASQGLYKQPNNYCSTTCPTRYYPDTSTQTCESCVAHCDVCSNAASCTTCTNPYYLSQVDSLCYSSCPAATYLNLGECHACPSNCNICSSGTVCTACAVSYYLSQVDNNSPYCSGCPSNCNACSSGTVCTTCASNYKLSQVDNSCYSTCPSGTYINETSCTACNVGGYYISGSQCLEDSFTSFSTSARNVAVIAMQAQSITSSVLPAITGGVSTSAILLIGFLADIDLYKYLNVPFPEDFVTFCQEISNPLLPNIFAKMDTVNGGNNPNSTIGKFNFWGVSATFLDNSNVSIAKELIALGIILGLNILVLISRKCSKFHQAMCKIRAVFMWNVFLSYYLGDFSESQLNSMIQMRENYVSSAYADLSLTFAVLVVATYPLLFGYMMYKLNQRLPQPQQAQERENSQLQNNSKSQTSKKPRTQEQGDNSNPTFEEHFTEKWAEVPPSIKIIAEDFSGKNRFTRNFILIMILESFLLILLVFFFQDYGLAQAIVYTIIISILLSLAAWQRPYKSVVQMGIILLNLSTKTIMGVFAIVFGVNDKTQFISTASLEIMGLILIVLILIVMAINLVVSLGIMVVSAYRGFKEWRARQKDIRSSSRSKAVNIAPRRNNFMDYQEEKPNASKISLEFHRGSQLQSSELIQHQSYDEGESQSVPLANKQNLILKDIDADSSRPKIIRKKLKRSSYPRRVDK